MTPSFPFPRPARIMWFRRFHSLHLLFRPLRLPSTGNMGNVCGLVQFLLYFASFSAASNLRKAPQNPTVAGVFLIIDRGEYTYNFTAARAACRALDVAIATLAQMERALRHGLETCKFGWTAEQTAVIPRLTPNKNCGQSKTGVVTWPSDTDKEFGVFCFNASDLVETSNTSTEGPPTSTYSSTQTTPLRTSAATKPPVVSTPKSLATGIPGAATVNEQSTSTSTFTLSLKASHSTSAPSPSTTTTRRVFSTRVPTLVSKRFTSKLATISPFLYASVPSNVSVPPKTAVSPSMNPAEPSLGGVSRALIILGIILLLLVAAGLVCYYKLNIFAFWPPGQQKDDVETEMWKHNDSEMDLHSQPDEEDREEESDRKYSSDMTLCVNPTFRSNPSPV